ncbi:MAG: gliding motility lipoprotein GldH [Flavobacteriaceae bacterium]|nr:gliding motility lipoprotein GldH [Flavobacteriaceae bacterium]
METRITRRNNFFYFIVGMMFVFTSCDSNRVYDQYYSLEDNIWKLEDPVSFEIQVTDTISRNNLFVNIRNNNEYQYSNLYLITHINFPDGKKVVDTLQYEMADKNGRFLGSGISEIKENKLFLKENILFPVSGNYQVSIYQAMRKNGSIEGVKELEGITDVGFRIEKVN